MKIYITGEYITICQLLKKIKIISSGGQAKYYLQNNIVKINNKIAEGRNSKVVVGSTVWINDDLYQVVNKLKT